MVRILGREALTLGFGYRLGYGMKRIPEENDS